MKRPSGWSPVLNVDYSAARAQAIRWLGDRYLLAKPINRHDRAERPELHQSRRTPFEDRTSSPISDASHRVAGKLGTVCSAAPLE